MKRVKSSHELNKSYTILRRFVSSESNESSTPNQYDYYFYGLKISCEVRLKRTKTKTDNESDLVSRYNLLRKAEDTK